MPDYKKRLKELQKKTLKPGEVIVTCHHCGRPWICASELELVSCPSCGQKTPRIEKKGAKEKAV